MKTVIAGLFFAVFLTAIASAAMFDETIRSNRDLIDILVPSSKDGRNRTDHEVTTEEFQRVAATKYPALAIKGSPFNARFLECYKRIQLQMPGVLDAPEWPLMLADKVAEALLKEATERQAQREADAKAAAQERAAAQAQESQAQREAAEQRSLQRADGLAQRVEARRRQAAAFEEGAPLRRMQEEQRRLQERMEWDQRQLAEQQRSLEESVRRQNQQLRDLENQRRSGR